MLSVQCGVRALTLTISTVVWAACVTPLAAAQPMVVGGPDAAAGAPAPVVSGIWERFAVPPPQAGDIYALNRPASSALLRLDTRAMSERLAMAPLEGTPAAERPLLIEIPMPDGTGAWFEAVESPIMEPALAAQVPGVRTYAIQGVEDRTAHGRFSLTPLGFTAFIRTERGAACIYPCTTGPTDWHLAFWKHDCPADALACATKDDLFAEFRKAPPRGGPDGTTVRRDYRLAVAATHEYTAFHSQNLPGTPTDLQRRQAAQAAIVTSINAVNAVYRPELAVRLVLVGNNINVVYYTRNPTTMAPDPTRDPYTNNNGNTMLGENQTNLDAVLGNGAYDIGHVFSTASGGVATLRSVCNNATKARGTTGRPNPAGPTFDIDYVCHEVGHQFGADHTFNCLTGSCGNANQHVPASAFEPGSGSTIMAYAGICGALNNLQNNSDPYFHHRSLVQIGSHIAGAGGACATNVNVDNSPPNITVTSASGRTVPAQTAFRVFAFAEDPDRDPVTYCWEQSDLGPAGSVNAADDGAIPIFRSFLPVSEGARTFPRLASIVSGTLVTGERYPTAARTMALRVRVRDNRGNAGASSTAAINVRIDAGSGPFRVTFPNAAGLTLGGQVRVRWNVANTGVGTAVNCGRVYILLSLDGGHTYPIQLGTITPNDGDETVTLPNQPGITTARIKVECADGIPFFDISNNDFSIQGCYADCDASTGPGVLDIFDFLCFQNRYAAHDPYACDCDVSSGPLVCDIFDFLCFQNAFAAGCP